MQKIFTDTIRSLFSYAQALKEDNRVQFVDVGIMKIVEDMISLNLLAANFRETYIAYMRVGKMVFNYQDVIPLLVVLGKDAPPARTCHIMHLDDRGLYTSSGEDNLLKIQVPHAFAKNDHKPLLFLEHLFYRHVGAFLEEHHVRHLKQDKEKLSTIALFLDTN